LANNNINVYFGLTLTMDSQLFTFSICNIYTLRNAPNDLWLKYVLDKTLI
jgi:hypothetical protein